MDSQRSLAEKHGPTLEQKGTEPARVRDPNPCGSAVLQELRCIEKLLTAEWGGRWGEPLTADELLAVGGTAFEPLFHEPPIGPVPEYLATHLSVHRCVAEYEEQFEELDRWKVRELSRWLKDRIGRNWCVAGKVYVLDAEKEEDAASEKFWLTLVEDHT
jgi:hypothetical protein